MKILNLNYATPSKQSGLSLIELMVAMAILAIITTIAVPSMKNLFERKSVFSIGDYFVRSIKFARIEAIQRGKSVSIISEAGTRDWSEGWRIESLDVNNNVEVIRSFPALSASPTFTSDDFGVNTLVIQPTGQVNAVGTFTLFYPGCVGNQVLSFNILLSGLIQRGVAACPINP